MGTRSTPVGKGQWLSKRNNGHGMVVMVWWSWSCEMHRSMAAGVCMRIVLARTGTLEGQVLDTDEKTCA